MKIALNGQIVETENIWKIDEILITSIYPSFKIHFFNRKTIEVILLETIDIDYSKNTDDQYDNHKTKLYSQLDLFRNKLIEVWSNNQSTIPRFDCGVNGKDKKNDYYDND